MEGLQKKASTFTNFYFYGKNIKIRRPQQGPERWLSKKEQLFQKLVCLNSSHKLPCKNQYIVCACLKTQPCTEEEMVAILGIAGCVPSSRFCEGPCSVSQGRSERSRDTQSSPLILTCVHMGTFLRTVPPSLTNTQASSHNITHQFKNCTCIYICRIYLVYIFIQYIYIYLFIFVY